MTARLRTLRAIGRAASLWAPVAGTVLLVAVTRQFRTPVAVPGRSTVSSLVWPLSPAALGLLVAPTASWGRDARERIAPRPAWQLRTASLLVVTGALLVAVAGAPGIDRAVLLRNGAALAGLALGAAAVLPTGGAWLPTALVVTLTWFFGPQGGGAPPAAWALLLQPRADAAAHVSACLLAALGATTHLLVARPVWERG